MNLCASLFGKNCCTEVVETTDPFIRGYTRLDFPDGELHAAVKVPLLPCGTSNRKLFSLILFVMQFKAARAITHWIPVSSEVLVEHVLLGFFLLSMYMLFRGNAVRNR